MDKGIPSGDCANYCYAELISEPEFQYGGEHVILVII